MLILPRLLETAQLKKWTLSLRLSFKEAFFKANSWSSITGSKAKISAPLLAKNKVESPALEPTSITTRPLKSMPKLSQ